MINTESNRLTRKGAAMSFNRTDHACVAGAASDEVEYAPGVDYRQAWARLLAALFLRTSRTEGWRNVFISAAEACDLDSQWSLRLARAKATLAERDWRRKYECFKAFELEPVPLRTEEDLADFIRGLLLDDDH